MIFPKNLHHFNGVVALPAEQMEFPRLAPLTYRKQVLMYSGLNRCVTIYSNGVII